VSDSPAPIRAFALRLVPGDDLRQGLETAVRERGLRAACVVSAVGSLHTAMIRMADEPSPSKFDGPFEIVSLSGTLSPDGVHLHIALADSNGIVIGGHLGIGSEVHTTAEVVIAELPGVTFSREPDPRTGYKELVIRTKEN
jgi:uncharacterized protein